MNNNEFTLLLLEQEKLSSKITGIIIKLILSGVATYFLTLKTPSVFYVYIILFVSLYALCSLFTFCSNLSHNYFLGAVLTVVAIFAFAFLGSKVSEKFGITANSFADNLAGIVAIMIFALPLFFDLLGIVRLIKVKKAIKYASLNPEMQAENIVVLPDNATEGID